MLRKLGVFLSIVGIAISAYLLYARMNENALVCGISSCQEVNSSGYSAILGIPVSAWGLLFYLFMFGSLVIFRKYKLFFVGGVIGVLFSAYLTYLEFFVIKAWCQWCLLSAWVSLSLFVIGLRLYNADLKDVKTLDSAK